MKEKLKKKYFIKAIETSIYIICIVMTNEMA